MYKDRTLYRFNDLTIFKKRTFRNGIKKLMSFVSYILHLYKLIIFTVTRTDEENLFFLLRRRRILN